MDSLITILNDLKVFFYGGMSSLPIVIAGTMLLIGLFTTNYALLFFLVGYLIIVPSSVMLINYVYYAISGDEGIVSDICGVIKEQSNLSSSSTSTGYISAWLPMITFFIGYLITNAISLYTYRAQAPDTSNANVSDKAKIENDHNKMISARKSHTFVTLMTALIFLVIILVYRRYTQCESHIHLIIYALIILAYGGIGVGWYYLINNVCSQWMTTNTIHRERYSDLLGIANRILSASETDNDPLVCVPSL
jgi:hypothetical protein